MILNPTGRRASSPAGQFVAAAFLIAWSAFALTGATGVQAGTSAHASLTDQALDDHAARIVARIANYTSADIDSDGKISFDERNAFLVSALLSDTARYLKCFSYSDPFKDRKLDLMEAYDVVRGLSYRSEIEKKVKLKMIEAKKHGLADSEMQQLKHDTNQKILSATETVLVGQDTLLDRLSAEPSADRVAMIHQKIDAKQAYEKQAELEKKSMTLLKKAEELEKQGRTEEAAELRDKAKKLQQMLEQKKTEK